MAAPEQTEKRRPRFDFSTLSDPVSVQSARKWAAEAGQRTIVELSLDDVVEDPDNPRTSFKQEALQALASSIRTRGVMQPVLVREKNADGKHVIIQGARRYRGSRIAGKTTIPAIIIPNAELENFDDYSQVIENVQRENLNAEEMCAFIVKRLDKGDKKGVIAEKLGLRAQLISAYLVIKDLAENVLALFRAGKIDGIEPLYDLTRLQKKAPELAAQLIAEAEENPLGSITQPMIRSALKSAEEGAGSGNGGDPIGTQGQTGTGQAQPTEPKSSNAQSTQPAPAASESGQQVGEGLSSQSESAGREEEPSGEAAVGATSLPTLGQNQDSDDGIHSHQGGLDETQEGGTTAPTTVQLPYHNPEAHKPTGSGDGRMPDPNHIKKPLLLGEIDGEPIKVLLARRPTSPGLVHVSWEATGFEEEVALDRIKLTLLSEMKVQETA